MENLGVINDGVDGTQVIGGYWKIVSSFLLPTIEERVDGTNHDAYIDWRYWIPAWDK
jgi:hypothetical protein